MESSVERLAETRCRERPDIFPKRLNTRPIGEPGEGTSVAKDDVVRDECSPGSGDAGRWSSATDGLHEASARAERALELHDAEVCQSDGK